VGESGEGVGTGAEDVGDEPCRRGGSEVPAFDGGDETGTDERGLAAAGSADYGEQAARGKAIEEGLDLFVATEEEGGIGGAEGAEAGEGRGG